VMWHYGITQSTTFQWCGVIHSTWPTRATWHMYAPTFNMWHRKNKIKNKKVTLHILTHGAMWGCGLTSLVVSIDDKNLWYEGEKYDIKEWDLNYKHPFPRVSGY
jgi:hypothetical protein